MQNTKSPLLKHGLAPIAGKNCHILLLGSMPSEKSLEKQEYYGHPRNAFWKIMQTITNIDWQAPYQERVQGLHSIGIALWDIIAHCKRQGSLDSNIHRPSITLNPLAEFFKQHPQLRWIGLNGGKAFELFHRYIVKPDILSQNITYAGLPSTSPAHTIKLDEKIAQWHRHLQPYLIAQS